MRLDFLLLTLPFGVMGFVPPGRRVRLSAFLMSSRDSDRDRLQLEGKLIDAVVDSDEGLQEIILIGRSTLPVSKARNQTKTTPCLTLSTSSPVSPSTGSATTNALCLPISYNQLKLVSVAFKNQPLSKSVLISALNPLLVNRDNGIFDNLPWATWSIDPQKRNRDAAGNFVDPKFHLGKLDAYNVMSGKDWKGRSLSIGNLAMRLKYSLEDETSSVEEMSDQTVLIKRILEVQRKELQQELAMYDYDLAIARQEDDYDAMDYIEVKRKACLERLESVESNLEEVSNTKKESVTTTFLGGVLDRIASMTTKEGENAAPYRGAIGYAPMIDTKEDLEASVLPYTSPFDLLREIIDEQLNAKVIGCVLENTSLLDGTVTVGGAVILQRKIPEQEVKMNGEVIGKIRNMDEDYGNEIPGGETFLVECDVDEAIGMALTTGTSIKVEKSIWQGGRQQVERLPADEDAKSVYEVLPEWDTVENLSFLMEGQPTNQSATSTPSKIRIPRTTMSLFDSLFQPQDGRPSGWFPTDNPIRTLNEFDDLSNSDKAVTLMQLSNFDGKLPRPRVVRQFERHGGDEAKMSSEHPLNKLLIPLIDESVRRQYLVRDAINKQDWERVQELETGTSKRQEALEMAAEYRDMGDEEEAAKWEAEAELYGAMRADVTQDEGSYSRFLDTDEWYAREQQKQRERNMKDFGHLDLD